MRISLIAIGMLSLILGAVGIFLPVLPTTPFILLSAFLFSKSSNRFHNMLLSHKIFGKIVRDYTVLRGITKKNKAIAISTIVIGYAITFNLVNALIVRILIACILIVVIFYILSFKTLN